MRIPQIQPWSSAGISEIGIAHIASNANTKTLRKYPMVTEVCVQYVRNVRFQVHAQGGQVVLQPVLIR